MSDTASLDRARRVSEALNRAQAEEWEEVSPAVLFDDRIVLAAELGRVLYELGQHDPVLLEEVMK